VQVLEGTVLRGAEVLEGTVLEGAEVLEGTVQTSACRIAAINLQKGP